MVIWKTQVHAGDKCSTGREEIDEVGFGKVFCISELQVKNGDERLGEGCAA
jgi:hypothetical protein